MAKTVLIPQTTIIADLSDDGAYYYNFGDTQVSEGKITVAFDGVAYNVQNMSDKNGDYGAPYDDSTNKFDFSTYPFNLFCQMLEGLWQTQVAVQDGNEHTIEVYTGEDEEEGGGNMPSSEITGKTFEEMLAASTQLDLSAKFKDYIYEFTNDVHAMGEVVYFHEEGSAKILFKDAEFKKPVTDYELLAMYLSEVVPVQLTDENKALQRFELLTSEKLHFLEYKDSSVTKRFYQIGDYFSGEAYKDLMGFVPGDAPKSSYAIVGTAIVGKDVVAPGEPTPPQPQESVLIPETTFTTEQRPYIFRGIEPFRFASIKIILDGEEMTLTGEKTDANVISYRFGDSSLIYCNFENANVVFSENAASTHTIKVLAR